MAIWRHLADFGCHFGPVGTRPQAGRDPLEGGVLAKGEQEGHEGVSLLAAFALADVVGLVCGIVPEVVGGLAVELANEGESRRAAGEAAQALEHGRAGDEVESAYAIDGEECELRVLVGEGADQVGHAFSARTRAQRILMRSLRANLLSDGAGNQAP